MTASNLLTEPNKMENLPAAANPKEAVDLPADWPAPLEVATPTETGAIVEIVKRAESEGVAIVPMGGGTQRYTGNPPQAGKPYRLLSLRSFDRILAHEPDDLTVTCEPGVTLAQLQTALAAKTQMLALDVPYPERATLGGIVSANTTGFQRGANGAPRDLLLGVRAVMAGGIAIAGGGRVVKNVAGYDVCKLFTGAWGTLGILTEVTFKVRAQFPAKQILAWETPDCATAATVGIVLHHAQLAPLFLLATNEYRSKPHLLVGMEGAAERVAWQAEEFARRVAAAGIAAKAVPAEAAEFGNLRDRQARNDAETTLAGRLSCLLTDLPETVAKLDSLGLALTADCMTGTVSCAASRTQIGSASAFLSAAPQESALIWTRANPEIIERWGLTRPDFALHRALKQALDPQNVFSPGRFAGGL